MSIKKIGNVLFWVLILGIMFYAANNFYSRYKMETEIENKFKVQNENAQKDDTQDSQRPQAFDFSLKDTEGNTVKLSDYRGKVVFLNFWATWCPPCRYEIPELVKASQVFDKGNDAAIIAVSLANGYNGETPDRVKKFVKDNNMTMKVLLDEEDVVSQKYGITSIPTTFIIDKNGGIYDYKLEPISYEEIMNIVSKLK